MSYYRLHFFFVKALQIKFGTTTYDDLI
jgi:hypothetical protein